MQCLVFKNGCHAQSIAQWSERDPVPSLKFLAFSTDIHIIAKMKLWAGRGAGMPGAAQTGSVLDSNVAT